VDTTDHKLLSLLRENARMPVATMAKVLGVSRGTVQNRLARLEKDGTVLGYTVRLKASAEDQRIRPTAAGTSSPSCALTASRRWIEC
jgi:DNA-binding Lrp family transcriptional regulator